MQKFLLVLVIGCAAFAAGYFVAPSKASSPAHELSADSLIQRGSYLVNGMGCDDCHSPKRMGPLGPEIILELRFSGFQSSVPLPPLDTAITAQGWAVFSPDLTFSAGPWGVSYASNISGDASGIGTWTEEQFLKALKEGKLKGKDDTRMIMPPMPWQNFSRLSDMDLKAIFAYLKSSTPVKNAVPLSVPR